ncbi:hypothetical protein [Halomonas koreensis]|uniref:Peptidase U49-like protein n=1 Tax=Halomonas koreensis TaxID=245385 RepID=A0ABU1G004_9GAMM|nr:hypothetical protein [Halomonas koreensis]MDR5866257.1 hypothetical protein [Halomonas koreensis]
MKSKKNPIIYIGGPGYSYEHFEPMIESVNTHFQEILSSLHFENQEGVRTNIDLSLDVFNPEKIRAYACPVDTKNGFYKIEMTAGLSYHIWLASRIFESSFNFFPWLKELKIIDKEKRKSGRRKLLADFSYYTCSYAIILHEISHIVLGHTDYLEEVTGYGELHEFGESGSAISEDDFEIRHAFEAEADRQSIEFLMVFLDEALGPDGLGRHIRFPNRLAVYEFLVYSLTSLSTLLQQLTGGARSVHPMPNERQYIFHSSITSYLQRTNLVSAEKISDRMPFWAMQAGEKLGLRDSSDALKAIEVAFSLSRVDDVLKNIDIKRFQHIARN